ncbi:uncharacterized protein LODBEIA_P56760 [Lodderomyces beijingensis]|uniref:TECPR1-like DysF domain-containing protein n=1 Tax=Lodderomyces beijingensis TaxID=1775926 RepID=A0ABP0ZVD9_9ASCO
MESVTQILGNILENKSTGTRRSSTSNSQSSSHHHHHYQQQGIPSKKRRSLDLDFSSFWHDDENTPIAASASALGTGSGFNANAGGSGGGGGGTTNTSGSGGLASASTFFNIGGGGGGGSDSSNPNYIADKLMEKFIGMVIPTEVIDDHTTKILQERADMAKTRKPLSFPVMQKQSNLLHQRNSDTYIFFNKVLKYVNWYDPYYTLGVTLIMTHVILKPVILTILPCVFLMVNTLIPHYLIIFPPDSNSLDEYLEVNPYPSEKPLDTYLAPKPVAMFSKEFFMNLTDTQNFMQMNISMFDFQVWLFTDYLYFKNEKVSSVILIGCVLLTLSNLYTMPLLFRFLMNNFWIVQTILILQVWTFIIAMHPHLRAKILRWIYDDETRLDIQNKVNHIEDTLTSILINDGPKLNAEGDPKDVQNVDLFESKLVEVYELQKLNRVSNMWELVGFTGDFYTRNDTIRRFNNLHARDKDHGKRDSDADDDHQGRLQIAQGETLREFKAPLGYKYASRSKWTLDYDVSQWVEANLIKDIVFIDDDEKWAYDVVLPSDAEVDTSDEKSNESDEHDDDKHDNDEINEWRLKRETMLDDDIYRRRRWIRRVVRETYLDKERPAVQPSHLAAWVS